MPFWRPPKVETIAREIAQGSVGDPEKWELFTDQARNMIALYAQELTGKNMPLPTRMRQLKARPHAIALEFRSAAQADAFARCIQALRLREEISPEEPGDVAAIC